MKDVKYLVKGTTAVFDCYTDGNLWYTIIDREFIFPIPIEDTKGGIFPSEIKAIRLMRWIRKHLELCGLTP